MWHYFTKLLGDCLHNLAHLLWCSPNSAGIILSVPGRTTSVYVTPATATLIAVKQICSSWCWVSAGGLLCVNVIGLYSGWNNMEMMEEPDTVNYKIQNHWYKWTPGKTSNSTSVTQRKGKTGSTRFIPRTRLSLKPSPYWLLGVYLSSEER